MVLVWKSTVFLQDGSEMEPIIGGELQKIVNAIFETIRSRL